MVGTKVYTLRAFSSIQPLYEYEVYYQYVPDIPQAMFSLGLRRTRIPGTGKPGTKYDVSYQVRAGTAVYERAGDVGVILAHLPQPTVARIDSKFSYSSTESLPRAIGRNVPLPS